VNLTPAVEAQELTIRYGDFTAVDAVSFKVMPGEIFGFLGANGAGKTTTIRALCGLLVPTSGRVRIAGLDPAEGLTPIKRKVGYMSQRFTLYNDLTVEENLAFAASLRKMPKEQLARRTRELFDTVGFDHDVTVLVRDLSGGLKQKLSLAAAMLHDPEIVFLDEPTAGVSPAAGIPSFVKPTCTVEAEQCGRIALMRDGRIIALDTADALKDAAFPKPLYEAEGGPAAPQGWAEALRQAPGVSGLRAHGLRYHLAPADPASLGALERSLPGVAFRRIRPSLEDVFIRLVEGGR
jgi:ABC-2 type transport system ATP-binding protein